MQTFLPYADFAKCARVLDNRRLNKQILEAYQIHRTLKGKRKGWRNHPCVVMWKEHPESLADYGLTMCKEFERRFGHRHSYHRRFSQMNICSAAWFEVFAKRPSTSMYRSLLLRKDPDHYRHYWPKLRDDIPFVWPDGTVSKS